MGTKSETILLQMVRKDYGAGTEPYINIVSIVGDVKGGKTSAQDAASRAEVVLTSCSPMVGKDRRTEYCKLIAAIQLDGNDDDSGKNDRGGKGPALRSDFAAAFGAVGDDNGAAATKAETK